MPTWDFAGLCNRQQSILSRDSPAPPPTSAELLLGRKESVMHGMYQILVVLLFIGMIAAPVALAAKAGRGASEDEA